MNSNRRTIEAGKSIWQTFTVVVGVLSTITTLIGVGMTYRQAVQIHTTQGHISDQITTVEDHMSALMARMNPATAQRSGTPAQRLEAPKPNRSDVDGVLLGLALDILKTPDSRENRELKDYARHIVDAAARKSGLAITPLQTQQLGTFLESRSGTAPPK